MATVLGIDEAHVRELISRVADAGSASDGPSASPERITDAFARAAWTTIAEPGDGVAGTLVQALGAVRALTAVIDRSSAADVAALLRSSGWADDAEQPDPVGAAREPRAQSKTLAAALERWRPRLVSADVVHALRAAGLLGVRLLLPGEPGWHAGLDDLGPHAPHALWFRGPALGRGNSVGRSVALVGARAATAYGEHVAMEASAGLVDRGFTIVSGAAYGIDGMAHRAALASGGTTIAFLAGGVDRPYPSGHESLIARMAETGAVVSELPCGATPTKWRFLQRNRLIAAASDATVVLEAGWRSGSINTAGHAATLGRPLGAVPGPVTSAASAGCHRLIRDYAATCVTSAQEMAELAGWSTTGDEAEAMAMRSPEETRLRDALAARSPRPVPELAKRSGLSTRDVEAMLGVLQLDGAVREHETGWTITAR
ncbi:DNA-processing protein DprA [Plantibacter sp. YIM 135249]|uniref:DNA-processing protein DprA n=1 Tax=Plantibacter sp. YIM 135249 TaxID=3423918 RepID=UPI003D33417D